VRHLGGRADRPEGGRSGAHGRLWRLQVAPVAVCVLLAGCQTLGPTALGIGRGAYNDVIARTESEQTLDLLVRVRYADPFGLLTVTSVTAGLKFSAGAKSEVGIGSQTNYAGNLVPFSAVLGYEDSPTISYTPVDAQAFLREWLAPTTIETLALMLQSVPESALVALLVERMNGLRSGVRATAEERTAFHRAATLLAELRERGIMSWARASGAAGRYELVLAYYSPAHIAEVRELLRLLALPGDPARESTIRVPVIPGVKEGTFEGLAIQTRSVAEIMRIVASTIDVPHEDVNAGLVAGTPRAPAGVGPTVRIHSSRSAPERATVAVQHRGWWFYVDDADLPSKRMFLQIQVLFLTRLSQATRGAQATPLLTIPVK
jgi:hypothetical protein